MKKPLLGITFLLAFCVSSFAQISGSLACPTLSLSGPAGIVNPNDIARYTASVDTKGQTLKIEYVWSSTGGNILGGQGTPNIEVQQPEFESLTITVEVKGFPEGCPNTTSETVVIDRAPEAVKLAQFKGSAFPKNKLELNMIVRILNDNPKDQLYVFFAYKKGTLRETMSTHQEKIFRYLTANGLDGSRITFHSMQNGVELVQFWRVPPGSENPTCKECEFPQLDRL